MLTATYGFSQADSGMKGEMKQQGMEMDEGKMKRMMGEGMMKKEMMQIMCPGGRVAGQALSWDLVQIFLSARFKGAERFKRRLAKVAALEKGKKS
jgi:hypothetical protein